jgi:hypothetical protein
VVGHPVRRRVVDRVARGAAIAEQLHLRALVVADGGEVLVAVLVDLRAAHHHVTAAVPHPPEHLAVGVEVLHDLAVRPRERFVVGDQAGLAVGHGEVGLEGGAGEPPADHGDGADGVGQDLAVTAEALRHGDHAHVRPFDEIAELVGHRSVRILAW